MSRLALLLLLAPFPALAAGSFDGTYRGSQVTLRTNNSSACAHMDRDNVVIRIENNRFSRSWGVHNGGDKVEVAVAADGSFKGETAALSDRTSRRGTRSFTMQGRISGGVLEAEFGSNLCAVKMTLRKS